MRETTCATANLILLYDSTREHAERLDALAEQTHNEARADRDLTRGFRAMVNLSDTIKDEVELAIDDLPEVVAVCARAGFETINFDEVARHYLARHLRIKRERTRRA